MSRFLKGGYIILDSPDANFYNYAYKAVNANKPVMLYNATGIPYYVKNIKLFGTTVVIKADDRIIAVLSDGTVINSNNISNIQAIPAPILTTIECGEIIIKVTDGEKYEYRVSRKKENTSICLTYVDASVVESVYYDKIVGGWEYKSTDIEHVVNLAVSDITTITTEQLNALKAGDVVIKNASDKKYTYVVSYKENDVSICLSYVDSTVAETVKYDYTNDAWVYDSTVSTPLTA